MTASAALELHAVTHRFGETLALDATSLTLQRGTVHALLGENGAGKTTLMHVAFGMIRPDAGRISVDGIERTFSTSADAIAARIGMVHQHFMLVPAMTVTENVALGGHGRYHARQARARVLEVSAQYGLHVDPDARVAELPVSAQQRVEILKALDRDAAILILDEPTAVLAPSEATALLHTVREFARRGGAVVLITHKLREALAFADEVTVLRRGRNVLNSATRDVTEAILAAAMIGTINEHGRQPAPTATTTIQGEHDRLVSRHDPVPPQTNRPPAMRIAEIEAKDERGIVRVHDVTLTLYRGEILGIAAIEGNGQRELLRVIAGRLAPSNGTVEYAAPLQSPTQPATTTIDYATSARGSRTPAASIVGFIPEDRQRDALVLDFPLDENVALAGSGQRTGFVDWRGIRDVTTTILDRYDVRASGPRVAARTLSGGNQQKLVIGRELQARPNVLVAENPSRGLDVHATTAVHTQLREARDHGMAVVVYAADLDEVLSIADRIVVMRDGRLFGVPHDRETIGRAMVGMT